MSRVAGIEYTICFLAPHDSRPEQRHMSEHFESIIGPKVAEGL
jgi:hypothetical protein